MDDSLFGSYWAQPTARPRYAPTFRGIPVHSVQQPVQHHHQPPAKITASATPPKQKVVQIPVRFVGSEPLRSASALKIQKVFRGFLVRKGAKFVISVRREMDEIERRISSSEEVDLIRRDDKERLRINEMLMGLLLKLDSVRGIDPGVRECRRAVIKKVIALQERVDAIVSTPPSDQIDAQSPLESVNRTPVSAAADVVIDSGADEVGADTVVTEVGENCGVEEAEDEKDSDLQRQTDVLEVAEDLGMKERDVEKEKEMDMNERVVENVKEGDEKREIAEKSWEEMGRKEKEGKDDNKRSSELLEKMMEDNERLMNLMTQLCHRNEMQTRMLNTLTHRVEQLEKAFICDRMRKKKKRHSA